MTTATSRLLRTIADFRQRLLNREAQAANTMGRYHAHTIASYITPKLNKLYADIQAKYAELEADREPGDTTSLDIPASWIYQRIRMEGLQLLISGEIDQFGAMALQQTRLLQYLGLNLGIESAARQLGIVVPASIKGTFGVPSMRAIESLVGATQKGSPLADLFNGFGREAADRVTKALVTGVTAGHNPRVIARGVQDALGVSRNRALVVSRQEVIRCYRSGSLLTYRENSDVVGKWRWNCARQTRTCIVCIAMDGKEFPLDVEFESHVQCFPAGTIVSGPRVVGSSKRWYSGAIIEVETVSGNFLTVTPNHPILTPNGWVKAGDLVEGGYVFSRVDSERPFNGVNPDEYQVPSLIEKVVESFTSLSSMATISMKTTSKDFHGDGTNGEVCIIRSNRTLWNEGHAHLFQPLSKLLLIRGHVVGVELLGLCPLTQFLKRALCSSDSIMSRLRALETLLSGHFGVHNSIGLAGSSSLDICQFQPLSDGVTGNAIGLGKGQFGLSRQIALSNFFGRQLHHLSGTGFSATQSAALLIRSEQTPFFQGINETLFSDMEMLASILSTLAGDIRLDRILKVNRRSFSGHVYNLQTKLGWYSANNIITHNCRCTPVPVTKSWDEILGPLGIDTSGIPETSLSASKMQTGTGAEWFEEQSEEVKQQIIGSKAGYDLYASGKVSLYDFVKYEHDDDWGGSRTQKSVKELVK